MKHIDLQSYIGTDAKFETNGQTTIFRVETDDLSDVIQTLTSHEDVQLKLVTATDERTTDNCFKIWYIFGLPKEQTFLIPYITLQNTLDFPSIALSIHQAWNDERKIKTFFGLNPVGHPDVRSIILHENWPTDSFPLRKDVAGEKKPEMAEGTYPFDVVEGEGIYEIPVGPVHAGIIEPGHFRFSMIGESIVKLEPRLGYVHKGTEKLFESLDLPEQIRLSEKISGDSSFSHSLAFCQALEQLSDTVVPNATCLIRSIFSELERLANHVGDIGAILNDTGYSFGGASGARLREMIMQINEQLTGSRFLRGVNVHGGVSVTISKEQQETLGEALTAWEKDFREVITIMKDSATVLNRLQGTGTITNAQAIDKGIVGIAGRAAGRSIDTRVDFPYAAYSELDLGDVITEQTGDVEARLMVRVREVSSALSLIHEALSKLSDNTETADTTPVSLRPNACTVSAVEGWRGEIVYFVTTDKDGNISRVAPRDPSFINWSALPDAGSDNVVPDFPLINKSFNLSYTGNDL